MRIEFLSHSGLWVAMVIGICAVLASSFGFTDKKTLLGLSGILRAGALLCLCLALCQPMLVRTEQFARGTILVDVSESMSEAQAEEIFARAKSFAGTNAELEVVPFAKSAAPIAGLISTFVTLRSAPKSAAAFDVRMRCAIISPPTAR